MTKKVFGSSVLPASLAKQKNQELLSFLAEGKKMNQRQIGQSRLVSQQIIEPVHTDPGEAVRWMGALQAQDYNGALWAVGLRAPGATVQAIEQAQAEGRIIRTWPMRGTLHFVAAADVRWMLELLTPRVIQRSQGRLHQLGLDTATLTASAKVIGSALEGSRQLTRQDLLSTLEAAGIKTNGQRGYHILFQLAQARLICFGPHAGKQPTFTLLDEWAPNAPSLPRDEALATLALRYFTSHGPATLQDFVWWSGLTVADGRVGLAAAAQQLGSTTVDGQSYYFADLPEMAETSDSVAALLPPFDEFLIAYRDRTASLDPTHAGLVAPGSNGIFNPIVVVDGRVVGTWKRIRKPDKVILTFSPFTSWSTAQTQALPAAVEHYSRFLGVPAVFEPVSES